MAVASLTFADGRKMPQVGLGTWQSGPNEVGNAVREAIEVGYRHFDLAHAYGNQPEIGLVFAEAIKSGKVKREDLFITSKLWNSYHSTKAAPEGIRVILEELQLDYLDLLLIHWPHGFKEGGEKFPKDEHGKILYSNVDYLETWKALEDAVKTGKVRSIGLSNFNHKQIQRVIDNATIKPVCLQVELNPYFQQRKLVDFCKKHGITVVGYSPLANNTHMFRKEGQPNLLLEQALVNIAKEVNRSPAQVALRWAVQRGLGVIPKSTKAERLWENFSLFDFKLSDAQMAQVDTLDRGLRIADLARDKEHPLYPFKEEY